MAAITVVYAFFCVFVFCLSLLTPGWMVSWKTVTSLYDRFGRGYLPHDKDVLDVMLIWLQMVHKLHNS